jgi:hypothetical protein
MDLRAGGREIWFSRPFGTAEDLCPRYPTLKGLLPKGVRRIRSRVLPDRPAGRKRFNSSAHSVMSG